MVSSLQTKYVSCCCPFITDDSCHMLWSVLQKRDEGLGLQAPTLMKLQKVRKCMRCGRTFGITRRQYNCQACGHVSYPNVTDVFRCNAYYTQQSSTQNSDSYMLICLGLKLNMA